MSIARNTIITLATQVAFLGFQVVGAMMSTRLLGTTAYGQMTLIMTTAMFFATAFQFSLVYGSLKVWSEGEHAPGEVAATLAGLSFLVSLVAMITQEIFLFTVGSQFFDGASLLALQIGVLLTPMMILAPLMEHAAKLRNEIVLYNAARLTMRGMSVIIICLLVLPGIVAAYGWTIFLQPRAMAGALVEEPFALWLFLLIAVVAFLCGIVMLHILLRRGTEQREDGQWRFSTDLARRMLSAGYKTYLAMLALFLISRVDFYVIKHYLDDDSVAVYGVAMALAEMVTIISMAMNTALIPHASSPDIDAAHDISARSMRHSLLYSSFAAGVFLIVAAPLVMLYGGENYRAAVSPLRFLLPGLVFYFLIGVYSTLAVRNAWFRGNNIILSLAVIADLAGAILVIERYGLPGVAAVKTLVFLFALVAYMIWFGRSGRLPIKSLWIFDAIDVSIWRRLAGKVFRKGRSTAVSAWCIASVCWESAR